jgi:glycosyltransferase involved in cell wall biosynthesis
VTIITKIISVIVAVKNEEKFIENCLKSLINQSFPKKSYKIIVVDGKSDDNTTNIVKKYIKKYPGFIKLYDNNKEWQSAGRNIAIKNEKKSDLIAYIDGHCIADKNWLKNLYETLQKCKDTKVAGVGSIHISPKDEAAFGKAVEQLFVTPLGGIGSSYRPTKEKKEVATVPYVLYKRAALESVGLYDEDMRYGEDFSLNYKLRKKGYKILVEPNAVVYYYKKRTFSSFLKQMYNYGTAKAIIGKRYPGSLQLIHYIPSFFLFSSIMLGFLSIFLNEVRILFFLIVLLYILAIAYFSLATALRKKDLSFVGLMPLLYVIEHFAYSIGFLTGVFKRGWAK